LTSLDDPQAQAHNIDDVGVERSLPLAPLSPIQNRTSGNVEEKNTLSFYNEDIHFSDEQIFINDNEQTQSEVLSETPDENVNSRERTNSGQSSENQDVFENRLLRSFEIDDQESQNLITENNELSTISNSNNTIGINNIRHKNSKENFQPVDNHRPLDFPVRVIHKQFKANSLTKQFRIQNKACAYVSSVLSYVTSEVLDLAGNRAEYQHSGHGRPIIHPR